MVNKILKKLLKIKLGEKMVVDKEKVLQTVDEWAYDSMEVIY